MINLIHSCYGPRYCKDIKVGTYVYSGDKRVLVTKPPVLTKCWRIKTSIKLDVICQNRFEGNKILFAGTHVYNENPNYGFYALGYLQTINDDRPGIQTMVWGKDSAYRLVRSVAIASHNAPIVSISPKYSTVKCITFPKTMDRNHIPWIEDLSQDSIRWFLQAYFTKTISGTIYIRKREADGISTLKMLTKDLTFMGALMIRLANIVFYYCNTVDESSNKYKKNIKDCYVFPATETWKILSIIPTSADMSKNSKTLYGEKRFNDRYYRDAIKYKGVASDCYCADIVSQEEVEDYILPDIYPDSNGFITKEVRL